MVKLIFTGLFPVSMPTLYELVLGNLNDRRPLLYEQTVLTEV